uniref:Claudin 10b n=1 Tax=Oryzias latipes TaxID=8090 RepID=A0A3P9HVZ5_ORYLA
MYQEIVAFVVAASGWVLESSTLATDYWKVSSNDGSVITTSTFWASLWKDCVTDSTGVSNCRDFPSMMALEDYIQACRGLMIAAVCLGFFGCVSALVGMKCTKIGGSDQSKSKTTCFAGINFVLGGLCSIAACSLYAHRITSEFFNPFIIDQKYELGAALFIGWAGGILCILGGFILCSSITESFSKSHSQANCVYKGAPSHSHITSITRVPAQAANPRPSATNSNASRAQYFDKNAYV